MAYDFGIVSALDLEHSAADLVFGLKRVKGGRRPFYECAVEAGSQAAHGVFGLATKKRSINMAICVQDMIERFDLPVIILTGIAAGVPNPDKPRGHVRLGDVVVGDRVVKFDEVKIKDGMPEYEGSTPTPDSVLLSHARDLISRFIGREETPWQEHIQGIVATKPLFARPADATDTFRLDASNRFGAHPLQPERILGLPMPHLGPIGSSAALLKDAGLRKKLASEYGLKAIEMEGGGVAEAAWECGARYFIVQGICDYGDRDKKDTWQYYAALASAAFIRSTIESVLLSQDRDDNKQSGRKTTTSTKVERARLGSTENTDRRILIDSLHRDIIRLPAQIFSKLVLMLDARARGYDCEGGPAKCAVRLIDWADSRTGCTLHELKAALEEIFKK